MFTVPSYIGSTNCLYKDFSVFVEKMVSLNENFITKFHDLGNFNIQQDKKFANLLEKVGSLETNNLDSKIELLNKFETKYSYFEERLKIIKQDLVHYTDSRIDKLDYGPE